MVYFGELTPPSANLHTKEFSKVKNNGKKKENGHCGKRWKTFRTA